MPKTTFAPGTIVSTRWLNGAQNIQFNGLNEDWSYPKLTPKSLNLEAIGTEFLRLSGDQIIEGEKTFSILPTSTEFAQNPNDFLTLKDVEDETNGFLRIFCASPSGGEIPVYDAVESRWECSPSIDGGVY